MGLAETVSKWLEGDAANSFFEFKLVKHSLEHTLEHFLEYIRL